MPLLAVVWSCAAGAADTPRAWLERMVDVSGQVSFRGTLVHMCAGKVDVVSVVHRAENGLVTERVRALDADGREIIRSPEKVMCIMPDQQAVVVGPPTSAAGHAEALLSPTSSFANVDRAHYRLQMLGSEHVAGQATQVIAIRPTDHFRYGYRLWLDRERAMPLKFELIGEDGTALEQTLFTEIRFADRIDSTEVEPTIVMDNFAWQRSDDILAVASAATAGAAREPPTSGWRANRVPPGFELTAAGSRDGDGNSNQMEHLVYSDGLASVSVFVEADVNDAERQPGMSEMGAVNAYTTLVDGFLVTAIGDVPLSTARMIALSVGPVPAAR